MGNSTGSVWAGIVTTGLVTTLSRVPPICGAATEYEYRYQARHPVLPCTPDSCQYQMDIVRTRGCNLQMIRDLFNRITYSNCWTLNNWTNTSRPWPGLLVTQTGGWWYVTTDYVRSHHNIHVLRGCSGLLGWCGLVWAGVGVLSPLLQNHKLNFLNWGGETLPPSWAASCRAGQKTIHIWDWTV